MTSPLSAHSGALITLSLSFLPLGPDSPLAAGPCRGENPLEPRSSRSGYLPLGYLPNVDCLSIALP